MSKAGPIDAFRGERGYTYAALLIVLVALGLGAQAAIVPTSTAIRRAQEEELIHRGLAYARAIESYWSAEPGKPAFPPDLEALLDDPRAEGRRHIRRLLDPVIATEWRPLPADSGGIAGVQPVSGEMPFRLADYPEGMVTPESVSAYSDWEFRFTPDDAN